MNSVMGAALLPRELFSTLRDTWVTTEFYDPDISRFARNLAVRETRSGLKLLSGVLLAVFVGASVLFNALGLGESTGYTCALLSALALHIFFSARAVAETTALQLLGASLLLISGAAFVLLANTAGVYDLAVFATIAFLFMTVPVMPWGLREALRVLVVVYVMFTLSLLMSPGEVDARTMWSLQFIMLGSGAISVVLVIRNTAIRKNGLRRRYELETANRRMQHLSNKDPLTNAWNRRYLDEEFDRATQRWQAMGLPWHFAFMDVNDFKPVNDRIGHEAGDRVLCAIAEVYDDLLAHHGFVVRMGGDEFALLFTATSPFELLEQGVQAVQARCAFVAHKTGFPIGLSMGLVSVPESTPASQGQVYKLADQMLNAAKARKLDCGHLLNAEQTQVTDGSGSRASD